MEHEGYQTLTTSNGKDGVNLFRKNPADLIITDIIMPEKEGIETIMELRRDFRDIKIIAMSGGGIVDSDTYLNIAKTTGAIQTLSKPFDSKKVLKTVHDLLEKESNNVKGDFEVDGTMNETDLITV